MKNLIYIRGCSHYQPKHKECVNYRFLLIIFNTITVLRWSFTLMFKQKLYPTSAFQSVFRQLKTNESLVPKILHLFRIYFICIELLFAKSFSSTTKFHRPFYCGCVRVRATKRLSGKHEFFAHPVGFKALQTCNIDIHAPGIEFIFYWMMDECCSVVDRFSRLEYDFI